MQIFWLYPDQLEAISNILWVYHITVLPAVQEIHFACTLATTSATGLAFLMEYRHQSLISKNWHGSLHKDAKLPSCNYGHEILLRANFKSILLPQFRAARKGQLSRSVTSNGVIETCSQSNSKWSASSLSVKCMLVGKETDKFVQRKSDTITILEAPAASFGPFIYTARPHLCAVSDLNAAELILSLGEADYRWL